MECPRCKKELAPSRYSEGDLTVDVDACPGCGGQLFARADLKRIEETVVLRPLQSATPIPTVRTQLRPVPCPRCLDHLPMGKVNSPRHPEVVMDVCPACDSVWLDRGELAHIQEEGLFSTIAWCLRWMRGE